MRAVDAYACESEIQIGVMLTFEDNVSIISLARSNYALPIREMHGYQCSGDSSLDQTPPDTCMVIQDVERECAAACASLAMPMPLNVSLRSDDLLQLQQRLLGMLMQPDPAVPFTPSLKVYFHFLPGHFGHLTGILWQPAATALFRASLRCLSRPYPGP